MALFFFDNNDGTDACFDVIKIEHRRELVSVSGS